jgi:hypothetical protein
MVYYERVYANATILECAVYPGEWDSIGIIKVRCYEMSQFHNMVWMFIYCIIAFALIQHAWPYITQIYEYINRCYNRFDLIE